jgi:glycosyltransferase involved in cell wall biosynthesis
MNLSILVPNHNEKNIGYMENRLRLYFPFAEIIVYPDYFGRGKGWALRNAFKQSTKDWVCMIDGDGDIQASEIKRLIYYRGDNDIIIGVKDLRFMPFTRKIISYLSRLLIKTLFRLPVSDTQTGIKLFKRETLDTWQADGFEFDIEILVNAHRKGFKITEIPVSCTINRGKSIKILWKTLKDTLQLASLSRAVN